MNFRRARRSANVLALFAAILGSGCADPYGDRFAGRENVGSPFAGRGVGSDGSSGEVEENGREAAIVDASYFGRLGPLGAVDVPQSFVSYVEDEWRTTVTLTDAMTGPDSMVIVTLPFQLHELFEPAPLEPLEPLDASIVACAGADGSFTWEQSTVPLDARVEADSEPDAPDRVRFVFTARFSDVLSEVEGDVIIEPR